MIDINPLIPQFASDPELDAINERAKALYRDGNFEEALPLAEDIAGRTKAKYGEGFRLRLAELNLGAIYRALNDRIKRLMDDDEWALAIKLSERLVGSTEAHFGRADERREIAGENLEFVCKQHSKTYFDLYTKIADLDRQGHFDQALPLGKRIVQVGPQIAANDSERSIRAWSISARLRRAHTVSANLSRATPLFGRGAVVQTSCRDIGGDVR